MSNIRPNAASLLQSTYQSGGASSLSPNLPPGASCASDWRNWRQHIKSTEGKKRGQKRKATCFYLVASNMAPSDVALSVALSGLMLVIHSSIDWNIQNIRWTEKQFCAVMMQEDKDSTYIGSHLVNLLNYWWNLNLLHLASAAFYSSLWLEGLLLFPFVHNTTLKFNFLPTFIVWRDKTLGTRKGLIWKTAMRRTINLVLVFHISQVHI